MDWGRLSYLLLSPDLIMCMANVLTIILKLQVLLLRFPTLKDATHLKDDIVQLKDPGVTSDNILIMESLNPLVGGQRISIRLTCQTYSASHLTRD